MTTAAAPARAARWCGAGMHRHRFSRLRRLALVAVMLGAHGAGAAPLDLDAALRGLEQSAGRDARVTAVTDALRAGVFERAESLALALRDATPGNADHELLLALARVGSERLAALERQLAALAERSPEAADHVRTVVARHYLSRGRTFLARHFMAGARTAAGESERMRVEAEIHTRAQRVTEAKAAQLLLLKRDPDDTRALLDMARLHLLEQQPARALAYTARVAELGVGGPSLALVNANAHMLAGHLEAADAAFAAVGDGPELVAFNRALLAQLRGDAQAALTAYRRLDPARLPLTNPVPGLVLAALDAGDVPLARRALDGLRAPGDPLTALLEATIAAAKGDLDAAGSALARAGFLFVDVTLPGFDARRYLGTEPAAALADLAMRNYLYRLGYFRLAARGPVPGGDRPPVPALSLITKARANWKAALEAEAMEIYAALRRAHPELVAPLVESADIHFFRGETETAIRLYEQAVREHPQVAALGLQLGNLLSTAGRTREALDAYAAVLARDPGNADAEARIASVLLEQRGAPGEALPHARRAHQTAPADPRFTALLGRIHHALGHREKALELLREALNRSGGRDPQVFAALGHLLVDMDRRDEARRALEHALNAGSGLSDRDAAAQAFLRLAGLEPQA